MLLQFEKLIQPKQLPDKYAVSSEAKTAINVAARVFVAYTTDLYVNIVIRGAANLFWVSFNWYILYI